jgi:ribulose-5-phosphate 4-epimerase/fuculose-1-phosphate aldolase
VTKVTESEARNEICRVGRSLFERGYVHATAGNISVKLAEEAGGGFLITPTDACLGFLNPMELAKLDKNGHQLSGNRASKTITLHRKIYDASESTSNAGSCIIHTHSTHCVALTLGNLKCQLPKSSTDWRELLPALTPYFVMKVGHVPVIDYYRPGSPQAADAVASAIGRYSDAGIPIRAVMLDRLGPNVWHSTLANAMATLEELEETAKLAQIVQSKVSGLDEDSLQELRETFGASW